MARLTQTGLNINVRTSSVAPDSSTYNGTNILFDLTDQRIGIQGDFIYAGTGIDHLSIVNGAQINVSKTTESEIDTYTISHASITTTQTNLPTAILATGGKFQVINGLQFDNNGGHVTGVTVSEYQLPEFPEDSDVHVKAYLTSAKSYILGHADLETTEGEYAYKTSTHYIQNGWLYQGTHALVDEIRTVGSGNVVSEVNNDTINHIGTAYLTWAMTGIAKDGDGNTLTSASFENGVLTLSYNNRLTNTGAASGSGNVVTGIKTGSNWEVIPIMKYALEKTAVSGEGNVIIGLSTSAGTLTYTMGTAVTSATTSGGGNVVTGVDSVSNGVITLSTTTIETTDENVKSEEFNGKAYLLGHTSIGITGHAKAYEAIFMSGAGLYADHMYVKTGISGWTSVATIDDINTLGKVLHFDTGGQTTTSSLSTTVAESVGEVVILSASGTYKDKEYEAGDIAIASETGTSGWVIAQANLDPDIYLEKTSVVDGSSQLSWDQTVTLATVGDVTIDVSLPTAHQSTSAASKNDTTLNIINGATIDSIQLLERDTLGHVNTYTYGKLTFEHGGSGASGSYGETAPKTLNWGDTFSVNRLSIDTYGHVTSAKSYTMTLPSTPPDEKVTSYATSAKTYLIGHATIGTNAQAGATSTAYIQNDSLYASHVYSDNVHVVTGVSADTGGNTVVGITLGDHGNVTLNTGNRLTNTGAASGSGNVVVGLKTGSNWEVIPIMGNTSDKHVQATSIANNRGYVLGHITEDIAGAYMAVKDIAYIYMESGSLYTKSLIATSGDSSYTARVLNADDITWNLI